MEDTENLELFESVEESEVVDAFEEVDDDIHKTKACRKSGRQRNPPERWIPVKSPVKHRAKKSTEKADVEECTKNMAGTVGDEKSTIKMHAAFSIKKLDKQSTEMAGAVQSTEKVDDPETVEISEMAATELYETESTEIFNYEPAAIYDDDPDPTKKTKLGSGDDIDDDDEVVEDEGVEWTDDMILRFVYEYRIRDVLWDPKHPYYKSHVRKRNAWAEIAGLVKVDVPELKRKMSCLLASYRKVFKKIRQVKAESGQDYKSTWFAYESFEFLNKKYKPEIKVKGKVKRSVAAEKSNPSFEPEVVIKEEPIEFHEEDKDSQQPSCSHASGFKEEFVLPYGQSGWTPTDDPSTSGLTPSLGEVYSIADFQANLEESEGRVSTNSNGKHKASTTSKVKKSALELKEDLQSKRQRENNVGESAINASSVMDSNSTNDRPKDQFDAYGEYIAAKLRKLDWKSCAYVQKAIGDIIFEAEMGKYSQVPTS